FREWRPDTCTLALLLFQQHFHRLVSVEVNVYESVKPAGLTNSFDQLAQFVVVLDCPRRSLTAFADRIHICLRTKLSLEHLDNVTGPVETYGVIITINLNRVLFTSRSSLTGIADKMDRNVAMTHGFE